MSENTTPIETELLSKDDEATSPKVASIDSLIELQKEIDQAKLAIQENKKLAQAGIKAINGTKEKADDALKDIEDKQTAFNKTIHEITKEIESSKKQAKDDSGAISDAKEQIEEFHSQLFDDKNDEDGEELQKSIKAQINKILTDAQSELSEITKEIGSSKKQAKDDSDAVSEAKKKIEEFCSRLFDDKNDEDGEELQKSVKAQINKILMDAQSELSEITKTHANKKNEFSELKTSLTKQITDLLPDALAAGLATGYAKSKDRYDCPETIFFLYILFLLPLVGIGTAGLLGYGIAKPEDIFFHLLNVSPLLAISSFGLWSIRLNRRLYEEYNHKQRVMQLYHGFNMEVSQGGIDPKKKEDLIQIMLDTVEDKPSLIMSKYEQMDSKKTISIWELLKFNWAKKLGLPEFLSSVAKGIEEA